MSRFGEGCSLSRAPTMSLPVPSSSASPSPVAQAPRLLAATPAHVAAACVLGLIAFVYSLFPLYHTDVWGHLRYAAEIVAQKQLPTREPFCDFADKDSPLVHFAWLSQLLMLGCFRLGEHLAGGERLHQLAGGVAGLRTLTLVLVLLFSWQLLAAYARVGRSLALGVVGLVLYSLPTPLDVLRPQLFGMVLFAFLLARLSADEWRWREVLLALAALVLWVNLHGSFVVGLGLLGVFLAGRFLSLCRTSGRWTFAAPWQDATFRRLALTLLGGVVLTALVNPHGVSLYLAVVRFSAHPVTRQFDEFQPLSTSLRPGALYFYVASMVVVLGSWLVARWRPTPTQVLMVLVFGLAPITQMRLAQWWVPLVLWLVLPAWAALARRRDWEWVTSPAAPRPRNAFLIGLIVLLVLPLTTPVQSLVRGPTPLSQVPISPVTAVTPWRLAEQLDGGAKANKALATSLERDYPQGQFRGRIFASETLGDYLLWRLPQHPVVVYAHSHVLGIDHWNDVMRVKRGDPGWDDCLDRWGVNLVVVETATHSHLREAIRKDSRWVVVVDDVADPSASRLPSNWLFVAIRKQPLLGSKDVKSER